MHKACRPDKTHSATVVPDSAALIRPTKLQTRHKACRADKALAPHPATVVPDGAALIRPTKLQTRYKACRPDKALAPHPATVVPDGAALIRPTKLQIRYKACRPDKALAPHPAKRIRAASVSGVYLPATCSQPADKRRRPDNKSVNPAASRPDTPYSSAPY